MCLSSMVVLIMSVTITKKKMILQIVKFLQNNNNESIITLHVPHRCDSADNFYVNKEIKAFNSKLKKTAKLSTHS